MARKATKAVTNKPAVNSVFVAVAEHYGLSPEEFVAYPKKIRDVMIENVGSPAKEPEKKSGIVITADQVRAWIPADKTDMTGWYLPKMYLPFTMMSVVGGSKQEKNMVINEFFEKGYVAGCKALRDFLPGHSKDLAYSIKVEMGYNKKGEKYIIPSVWVDMK